MTDITKEELIQALKGFPKNAKIAVCEKRKLFGGTSYRYYDIVNVEVDSDNFHQFAPRLVIERRK